MKMATKYIMATSTTELTSSPSHSIRLARSLCSCFIKNSPRFARCRRGKDQKGKLEAKLKARREKKAALLEAKKKKELLAKETRLEKQINVIENVASHGKEVQRAAAEEAIVSVSKDAVRGAKSKWLKGGKLVRSALALKKKQEKEKILAGEGEGGRGGGLPPKWVMQKLEAIEAALQSMDRDRDKSSPVPAPSAAQTYQDPQDVMLVPNSDSKLSVIAETDLNPVEKSRLKYGREIVAILGMADSCKLEIARALPGKGKNDGKKRNNAFRNSYWFDASTRNVYVHVDRVNGGGGTLRWF